MSAHWKFNICSKFVVIVIEIKKELHLKQKLSSFVCYLKMSLPNIKAWTLALTVTWSIWRKKLGLN